jgi:hypothetical protein
MKVAHTYKECLQRSKENLIFWGAPCIDGLVPTSLPKLGTPSSDSAPVFNMLKTWDSESSHRLSL